MTFRRTPPLLLRRAVWAVAVACAVDGPLPAAEPVPTRAYPPTYSSRKAPWYDPFRIFTDDKKVVPASKTEIKPLPTTPANLPAGAAGSPAWKWYGYGTPLPGGGPLGPAASPSAVPGHWYTASGTTPGAVPTARIGSSLPGLIPDPMPEPRIIRQESTFANPVDGPSLPSGGQPPFAEPVPDADWAPAPATIRPPSPERIATNADPSAPPATLKPPVREDAVPASTPTLGTPVPPTAPASDPPAESPDIPVVPAPGIVVPPLKVGVSKADQPLTARGRAPELDPVDVIRRACGSDVRVMEIAPAGPHRLVIRLSGRPDAARAAIDRLSRATELVGWQIDIEMVTALQQ